MAKRVTFAANETSTVALALSHTARESEAKKLWGLAWEAHTLAARAWDAHGSRDIAARRRDDAARCRSYWTKPTPAEMLTAAIDVDNMMHPVP